MRRSRIIEENRRGEIAANEERAEVWCPKVCEVDKGSAMMESDLTHAGVSREGGGGMEKEALQRDY